MPPQAAVARGRMRSVREYVRETHEAYEAQRAVLLAVLLERRQLKRELRSTRAQLDALLGALHDCPELLEVAAERLIAAAGCNAGSSLLTPPAR
jgi:hypothetical protein